MISSLHDLVQFFLLFTFHILTNLNLSHYHFSYLPKKLHMICSPPRYHFLFFGHSINLFIDLHRVNIFLIFLLSFYFSSSLSYFNNNYCSRPQLFINLIYVNFLIFIKLLDLLRFMYYEFPIPALF